MVMKIVVGLGNPGRAYRGTRHNLGFDVIAGVASRYQAGPAKGKFQAELVEVMIGGQPVVLLSPLTYMNRSGQSVRAAVDFYKLPPEQLLVICDDMNLPLGVLRFRTKGSSGGQKGLADVARHLGVETFPRLRIGIGRPPQDVDPVDFVLERFSPDELPVVERAVAQAVLGVDDWVTAGTEACMNRYNGSTAGGEQ